MRGAGQGKQLLGSGTTVDPHWNHSGTGPTREQLSSRALEQVGAAVLDPRFLLPRAVSSWPAWGAGVLLQLGRTTLMLKEAKVILLGGEHLEKS